MPPPLREGVKGHHRAIRPVKRDQNLHDPGLEHFALPAACHLPARRDDAKGAKRNIGLLRQVDDGVLGKRTLSRSIGNP